jgi:hypothetical protein
MSPILIIPSNIDRILSFMLKRFSYNPQYRITAIQLLCNASFRAVMGIYCAEYSVRGTNLHSNLT